MKRISYLLCIIFLFSIVACQPSAEVAPSTPTNSSTASARESATDFGANTALLHNLIVINRGKNTIFQDGPMQQRAAEYVGYRTSPPYTVYIPADISYRVYGWWQYEATITLIGPRTYSEAYKLMLGNPKTASAILDKKYTRLGISYGERTVGYSRNNDGLYYNGDVRTEGVWVICISGGRDVAQY